MNAENAENSEKTKNMGGEVGEKIFFCSEMCLHISIYFRGGVSGFAAY